MEAKKKGSPKIILVAAAVIAGGVFGWCGIQNSRKEQALAEQDFDTAIACCQRNLLTGDEALGRSGTPSAAPTPRARC